MSCGWSMSIAEWNNLNESQRRQVYEDGKKWRSKHKPSKKYDEVVEQ